MRILSFLAFFMLFGCATLRQEIDYPGGIPDYQANRLLPAFSHTDRADRYLIALTLLSQLAAETATDSVQAATAAAEIERAHGQIRRLKDADEPTSAYHFAFETMSYDIQASLYALSKTIAMNADLEVSLRKLAELDVIWLMRQLGNLQRNLPAARRSAALYRDITILVADAIYAKCPASPITDATFAACENLRIEQRTRTYANLDEQPTHGPLHDARAAIRNLMRNAALDMELLDRHRNGLLYHIRLACWRLHQIQRLEDVAQVRSCLGATSRPE